MPSPTSLCQAGKTTKPKAQLARTTGNFKKRRDTIPSVLEDILHCRTRGGRGRRIVANLKPTRSAQAIQGVGRVSAVKPGSGGEGTKGVQARLLLSQNSDLTSHGEGGGCCYWIMGENTEHPTGDRALNKSSCLLGTDVFMEREKDPKENNVYTVYQILEMGLRTERNVETESSPGGFPEGKEQVR